MSFTNSFVLAGPLAKQSRARSLSSITAVVGEDHEFEIPAKLVKTPADMKIWEKSEAYFEYLGFILAINESIKSKSNSQGSKNQSENIVRLGVMLDKLSVLVDETPAIQQPQRFGNVAFRTWFQKMRDGSLTLLHELLPHNLVRSIPEVVSYLVDSFGNQTRIDYGTGHEIAFVMFLCCLFKIGFLKDADKVTTGCFVFPKYLELARKLQKVYRMEPAGSHGVWSLDDFQFVPFIWGSSQLIAHPTIEPSGFLNEKILNDFGHDYMFLSCIQYINSVKSGPFAEHSNQLWSISGVSSWSKINAGLVKMYKAEVLSKFPVVQHIVFGTLFTLKPMEQCTGLMTPKQSMAPPPMPSGSISSKESQPSTPSNESLTKGSSVDESKRSSEGSSRVSSKEESDKSEAGDSDVCVYKRPSDVRYSTVEDEKVSFSTTEKVSFLGDEKVSFAGDEKMPVVGEEKVSFAGEDDKVSFSMDEVPSAMERRGRRGVFDINMKSD